MEFSYCAEMFKFSLATFLLQNQQQSEFSVFPIYKKAGFIVKTNQRCLFKE